MPRAKEEKKYDLDTGAGGPDWREASGAPLCVRRDTGVHALSLMWCSSPEQIARVSQPQDKLSARFSFQS